MFTISACRHIVKPQTFTVFLFVFFLQSTHTHTDTRVMLFPEIALGWLLSLWLLILSFSEVTDLIHYPAHFSPSISHLNSHFFLFSMCPYRILEVKHLWTTKEKIIYIWMAEVRIKCSECGQLHLVGVCVCVCVYVYKVILTLLWPKSDYTLACGDMVFCADKDAGPHEEI